jgi:hypothetical protein
MNTYWAFTKELESESEIINTCWGVGDLKLEESEVLCTDSTALNLTDWLAGWLIDWLAGWLAGWLTNKQRKKERNKQTNWLTDWLTDWLHGGVFLEKLTGPQLDKKFPAFCGNRRFITAFASACHLSLFCARSLQPMLSHPTIPRFSHLVSITQVSPPKPCMHLSCLPYVPHALAVSFFLIWWTHETS